MNQKRMLKMTDIYLHNMRIYNNYLYKKKKKND